MSDGLTNLGAADPVAETGDRTAALAGDADRELVLGGCTTGSTVRSGRVSLFILLFLGGNWGLAANGAPVDLSAAAWTGGCGWTPWVWMCNDGGPVTLRCPWACCFSIAILSLGLKLVAEPVEPERGVDGTLPWLMARRPAVNLPGLGSCGIGGGCRSGSASAAAAASSSKPSSAPQSSPS